MDEVTLKIDNREFGGWETVSITRSLEQIASTFSIAYTDKWSEVGSPFTINPGDACTVMLGTTIVLTGYVDECSINYTGTSHTMTVSGRSKAGDLVDCSAQHLSGKWNGRTILQIATDLCSPFGITVTAATPLGDAFTTFSLQEGEAVFEALERAARARGVLFLSDVKGNLVIARAGTERIATDLELGKNIMSGALEESWKDRFKTYLLKAHAKESDSHSGTAATTSKNSATDPHVERYRPLTVISENPETSAQLLNRAKWECNVRAGRSRRFTYVVPEWTYDGKHLWEPNKIVRVCDPFLSLDADLIIVSVAMTLDGEGTTTELQLTPKEAFSLIAIPPKVKKKKKSAGW